MVYELEMQDKEGFAKLKEKIFEEGKAIKKTAEGMLRNANFKQNQTRQNYLDRLAKNEFKFVDHPILLGNELASVDLLHWDAPYMRRFVHGIAKVFKFNSEKKLKNFVVPEYK
uniref:Glutathione S-transferase n=2 Tax=Bursaphelenchus xylophilus TaxID=6326 RepID=A0A1I7SJY9_BURXY